MPPGDDELPLCWNISALDRQILRKCTRPNGVTYEPVSQAAFVGIFRKSLLNSGYLTATSIHAIRRQIRKVDCETIAPVLLKDSKPFPCSLGRSARDAYPLITTLPLRLKESMRAGTILLLSQSLVRSHIMLFVSSALHSRKFSSKSFSPT
jgi:hypothetical protein